jgi:hypothetical protein
MKRVRVAAGAIIAVLFVAVSMEPATADDGCMEQRSGGSFPDQETSAGTASGSATGQSGAR